MTTSVWSASDAATNSMTLSNGGLTVVAANTTAWQSVRGTVSKTTGKLYVEFSASGSFAGSTQIFGLASSGFNAASYVGNSSYSGGMLPTFGANEVSSGFTSNYAPTTVVPVSGDVWALAVEFGTGNVWIAKNNVWMNSSNPATGSLPIISFVLATVGALFPAMSLQKADDGVWTLQPTPATQKYAPPSGFSAWDASAVVKSAQARVLVMA
jgi:hypothetical protein